MASAFSVITGLSVLTFIGSVSSSRWNSYYDYQPSQSQSSLFGDANSLYSSQSNQKVKSRPGNHIESSYSDDTSLYGIGSQQSKWQQQSSMYSQGNPGPMEGSVGSGSSNNPSPSPTPDKTPESLLPSNSYGSSSYYGTGESESSVYSQQAQKPSWEYTQFQPEQQDLYSGLFDDIKSPPLNNLRPQHGFNPNHPLGFPSQFETNSIPESEHVEPTINGYIKHSQWSNDQHHGVTVQVVSDPKSPQDAFPMFLNALPGIFHALLHEQKLQGESKSPSSSQSPQSSQSSPSLSSPQNSIVHGDGYFEPSFGNDPLSQSDIMSLFDSSNLGGSNNQPFVFPSQGSDMPDVMNPFTSQSQSEVSQSFGVPTNMEGFGEYERPTTYLQVGRPISPSSFDQSSPKMPDKSSPMSSYGPGFWGSVGK